MSYNKKLFKQMVEESKQKKTSPNPFGKDKILDPLGQWKFPGQVTRIPSNRITMQGVPYPVLAKGSSGAERVMYPDQEYFFPDSTYVDEYPLVKAQNGINLNLPKYNKPEDKQFSVNPYTFGFNPAPGVNIFGIGANPSLNLLNTKKDRLALTGDISSVSVGYPGGQELFTKPQYGFGVRYTRNFETGGDISIPNLEEGNWLDRYDKGGQATLDKFYKNLFQNINKRVSQGEDASFGKRALGAIETVVEDPLNALNFLFTKKQKLSNPWENPYGVDFISDRQGNIKKTWAPKYGAVDNSITTETTRPPIYVDNPNDPRLKAHNDSLYYYNQNPKIAKEMFILNRALKKYIESNNLKQHNSGVLTGTTKESSEKEWNKARAKYKKFKESIGLIGIESGATNSKIILPRVPNPLYKRGTDDNLTPENMMEFTFKKPVQPYILQEQPQLKMVGNERRDISPSFNTRIPSPNIPSIARPDNKYMVSYTDEEGVGREEYFPTAELADQYMDWRRANNMFYGTGMSRRGVFQGGGENDGVQRIKIKNNDGTYSYLRSDSKEYYDLIQSGAIDESSFNQKDTAFSLKQKPKKVIQAPVVKKDEGPSFLDNLTSNFSNLYSKFRTAINEAPLDARGITIANGFKGVAPSKPNTAAIKTALTAPILIQSAASNVLANKIKDNYRTFTKNISDKYNTFTKDVSDKYNEALEIAEGIPSQIERYIEMMQPESKEAITGKAKVQHQKQEVKKGDKVIKRDVLPYGFSILKDEKGKPKIVRDVSSSNPKDSLAEFINVYNNDIGTEYIIGHKIKEVTDAGAKSKFDNVHAVAHFLKDSDILPGQKITPKTWRVGKGLKFYDFKTNTPGKTISTTGFDDPEWYRMLYKQSGNDPNRYRVRFVKNKNLTEKDKKEYQTDFTSNAYHKFSDIDWDGKGESTKYFAKSNWVPTKLRDDEGKIIHTYIPYKDKNSFSRFSGGSITYLFRDPVTRENMAVDVTGSVNTMKKIGKDIIKMYGIKPEDLNLTYQDMGSYSAKPKAKNGVLDYNQWKNFNTYNRGFSGAPLMIPIKKNGGETNNWLNKYN